MSDPDAMPDPIDKAYVEAEAVLSDEAARAARRARVFAAVARQGAPDAAAPAVRSRAWRRGGWLVAASVTGLTLVIALQLYRPSVYPPPSKPTAASPIPGAAPKASAAAPASPAPASPNPASPPTSRVSAPPAEAAPRAAKSRVDEAPVVVASPAPPPAAPSAAGPAPRAFPGEEPAPAPPPQADAARESAAPDQAANQPQPRDGAADDRTNVTEMVVTAEKRQSRRQSVPAAVSAFTGRIRQAFDPGARLRSAAAAGRTADVEALLKRGAPVDSADADGETALMKSIEADHPATAALLRQHGASLDQQNHAGESARDMAADQGDAELDQALGLRP